MIPPEEKFETKKLHRKPTEKETKMNQKIYVLDDRELGALQRLMDAIKGKLKAEDTDSEGSEIDPEYVLYLERQIEMLEDEVEVQNRKLKRLENMIAGMLDLVEKLKTPY